MFFHEHAAPSPLSADAKKRRVRVFLETWLLSHVCLAIAPLGSCVHMRWLLSGPASTCSHSAVVLTWLLELTFSANKCRGLSAPELLSTFILIYYFICDLHSLSLPQSTSLPGKLRAKRVLEPQGPHVPRLAFPRTPVVRIPIHTLE